MFIKRTSRKFQIKQTGVVKNLQIFDLLLLSRKERETRDFCRAALRLSGQWKKIMSDTIHSPVMPCARIRGAVLRKQAKQAIRLYKAVRHNRIAIFEFYINNLPQIQGFKRLAS